MDIGWYRCQSAYADNCFQLKFKWSCNSDFGQEIVNDDGKIRILGLQIQNVLVRGRLLETTVKNGEF